MHKHIPRLTYEEAITIIEANEKKLLHPRALKMARENAIPLEILSFNKSEMKSIIVSEEKNRPNEPIFEVDSLALKD